MSLPLYVQLSLCMQDMYKQHEYCWDCVIVLGNEVSLVNHVTGMQYSVLISQSTAGTMYTHIIIVFMMIQLYSWMHYVQAHNIEA